MARAFGITPMHTQVEVNGHTEQAWQIEIRDLARGFAGALFVSLPLLYTMEMWQFGRTLDIRLILFLLVLGYFGNVGLCAYAGFRQTHWERGYFWDGFACMGIGAVASVVTLLVAGIIDFDLSPEILIKIVALEIVPTGLGAAVARNQLGSGDSARDVSPFSTDMSVVVGTMLGGVLFAFNVAPTVETMEITMRQSWWLSLATMILSIAVAHLIVHLAQFDDRDLSKRKIFKTPITETLFSYALALLTSYLLLFGFGYVSFSDPYGVWIPRVVTLAYATTLGGAAGRLIL